MTDQHHDETLLETAFEAWRVDEAPEGFAQRVVLASTDEKRATRSVGRVGLVVPLLLAALLVSFGAAAAWGRWVRPPLISSADQGDTPLLSKSAKLNFHVKAAEAHAEREASAVPAPSIPPKKMKAARPAAPADVEGDAPEPPAQLHLPRCECGTSGVVCSCSD